MVFNTAENVWQRCYLRVSGSFVRQKLYWHSYISLRIRVQLVTQALLCLLMTTPRCALCVRQSCAVRERNPNWMACSVLQQMPRLVRPSLPLPPIGNLKCRVCRKKKKKKQPCCDSDRNCDEWGLGAKTSIVTKTRDIALDLLLGFRELSKKCMKCMHAHVVQCTRVFLYLCL